jgi:FkbM family methyltransferase
MADGTRLHVSTASWIEWEVFFFGAYDPATLALLRRCVRPGRTAIDVGANVGTHALAMAAARAGRVVAFEPSPAIFKRLQENLALNPKAHVDARQVAVSDQAGTVTLFEAKGWNLGEGSLMADPALTQVLVPSTTLDAENILDVDVIKIDVEGFEAAVLAGARTMLSQQHPIIVFEYNRSKWAAVGYTLDSVLRDLSNLGYGFLSVGIRGLEAMPEPAPELVNIVASDGTRSLH